MFSEPVTTQFRTSHRPSCTVSSQILLFGTPGDVHSFRTSKDIALLYGNRQDQEQVYVVRRMTHVQVGARDVDKDPLTRFEREATDALVDRGFTWIMGSWVVDLQSGNWTYGRHLGRQGRFLGTVGLQSKHRQVELTHSLMHISLQHRLVLRILGIGQRRRVLIVQVEVDNIGEGCKDGLRQQTYLLPGFETYSETARLWSR